MKLLILAVCIVAVTSAKAKKPKVDRSVKLLKGLCSADDSGYVRVDDDTYDDIFSGEMLGGFCDDFFAALNESAKSVSKYVKGIKALSKVCKGYTKKYSEAPTEGPLVGFEAICNASTEAAALTLNNKPSRKALAGLVNVCVAQEAGNLRIKVANFTEVFDDLEEFCGVYMNETNGAVVLQRPKKRGDSVNGIKVLGGVCKWYIKKFEEFTPEGSLAELAPICEDYEEIKLELEEEKEEEEE